MRRETKPDVASPSVREVALLFSDIVGSTRWWELAPEAMRAALERHDELMTEVVGRAGGHVFKTVGDAVCAVFAAGAEAIEAAAAAQRAIAEEPWPDPVELQVRVAVHVGPCFERAGDYFGPAVNRVARLEAAAHGGQVVLSRSAAQQVPVTMSTRDLGWHRLKDLDEPEHVFQLDTSGLAQDFPPLRLSGWRDRQNNLPADAVRLVGRAREVADVLQALETSRLLTVAGPGGAGKTRLAVAVARRFVDRGRDDVWFADLAPEGPDGVVAAIAAAIGARGTTRPEDLAATLADDPTLLILDNCEHVVDAAAGVVAHLLRSAPALRVLATSREPLSIAAERVWRIPPLGEGAELFVERARAAGAVLDEAEPLIARIDGICRRLDGLPLAIELTAALTRTVGLDQIEASLDERLLVLEGDGRDAAPRQRTLRASLDWSYELLGPSDRRTLRRLSVLVGEFDLEAAAAVIGDDTQATLRAIDRLVTKSLVAPVAGRHRLLETIEQYAAERLAEDRAEARDARAAQRAHFTALARRAAECLAGPDQRAWLVRLERELGNLRRAIAGSVADERVELIVALRRFWLAHDHQPEVLALLRSAADDGARLPARALVLAAEAALVAELATQPSYAEAALRAARDEGDDGAAALALETQCSWAFLTGEGEGATDVAVEALALARRAGDPTLLSEILLYSSRIDVHSPASGRWLDEALALARAHEDSFVEARVLNDVGVRALSLGDLAEAEQAFRDALEVGPDPASPTLLNNLALVRARAGDVGAAAALARSALVAPKRFRSDVAYTLLALSLCALAQGDALTALTLHEGAARELAVAGEAWQEPESTFFDEARTTLRERLGDRWNHHLQTARAVDRDEVLRLALGCD